MNIAIINPDGTLQQVVFDLGGVDLGAGENLATTVACPDGWPDTKQWDVATQAFIDSTPPRPPISALAFIGLFTLAEQLAAYASDDAAVKLTIGQTQAAGTIHLDDPRVADGLDLLASVNIIAPARIPEILAGTPPQ